LISNADQTKFCHLQMPTKHSCAITPLYQ